MKPENKEYLDNIRNTAALILASFHKDFEIAESAYKHTVEKAVELAVELESKIEDIALDFE